MSNPSTLILFIFLYLVHQASLISIGVNYGTVGNNLPAPSQVASFLKQQTFIDRIKLFDTNPDILSAFSGTGILVTVSALNQDIPNISNLQFAQSWLQTNILPFHPLTSINRILVGNEILATSDKTLIAHLLPAMKTLQYALKLDGIHDIEVTTPHSLGILSRSQPPSSGSFRKVFDYGIFAPILKFHRDTNSSFMINPYPFFGFGPATLDYALFRRNDGVLDGTTGVRYTNMLDAQLDAVHAAMSRVGYGDVGIIVGETGWPSLGETGEFGVSLDNAVEYNGNLVKHVNSGVGTPMMPNRTFETYIFSLFNENLKPSISEQNYGLFKPDLTPVYDVGVLRDLQFQSPPAGVKEWCIPKPNAGDDVLQANIDFVCRSLDCGPIQDGGSCYDPNTVRAHAAYAMNSYFQTYGRLEASCNFAGTGMLTSYDPSTQACAYIS